MPQLTAEQIRAHQQELAALRARRGSRAAKVILLFVLVLLSLFLLGPLFFDAEQFYQTIEASRVQLSRSGSSFADTLISRQQDLEDWLITRGTQGELAVYRAISALVFSGATSIGSGHPSLVENGLAYLYLGILQAAFVLVAGMRFWISAALLSGLWGLFRVKVYGGRDLLGEMGNGKLFFSGIKASLDRVNSDGAPEVQITGLACPAAVSPVAAKTSQLYGILERYKAVNDTTIALAAIILFHEKWPAYVAPQQEEELLANVYAGASLPENACIVLEQALSLHSEIANSVEGDADFGEHYDTLLPDARHHREAEKSPEKLLPQKRVSSLPARREDLELRRSAQDYGILLRQSLARSLIASLRQEIALIPAAEVAAIVLAYEAGKVLAYEYGAGKWLRKSQFSQLTARAVLHSIPSLAADFDFATRADLRRALIYGSRTSAFSHVRFPNDLSLKSRALRQWVELLMACPHELQSVTDDVELFAYMCDFNFRWSNAFFDEIIVGSPEMHAGILATPHNLFFLPAAETLRIFRRVSSQEERKRLLELLGVVSQKQKLERLSLDGDEPEAKGPSIPQRRIMPPYQEEQERVLADMHDLTVADAREWGALRCVLNYFGWLGRRVGDYTVPSSSLIFITYFTERNGNFSDSDSARQGAKGIAAFRGTRLEERFGRSWRSRFINVRGARMAETTEDYQELLQGREPVVPDAEDSGLVGT